jgi:lambda family phage tail tape measure protein
MATIEDFILRFKTVGTDGIKAAQSGIQGLKDDVAGLTQIGGPLGNTLNGIIGKLGPIGLAAGAAGAAFAALGMKAINIADEIQDMADATGIGAGQLMNLKQSLIEAGGKAESFVGITSKLSVGIGQAMDGNEKFQKSFRDLGVYITDSNGKIRDSGDILQDVVGKLAGIEDPAVRSARAVELLGKEASKIDWSKVSAGRDAIKDEQIAALANYRGEIDKLANSIETKLVTAFGELATAVNKGGLVEGLAVAIEQMGTLVSYIPGLGKMADLVDKARMERLGARAGGGRGGQGGPTAEELKKFQDSQNPVKAAAGGFGGPSEQAIKAAADSRQRIAQSEAEIRKQLELSTANQVGAIEINAKYEAVKAKAEIDNKERLSAAQKTAEYVAKEKEIFAKRDNDIAKIRRELNVRIATEEMAQAEQNAREMAGYYQQVDQARLQAFDQTESIRLAREELARRITLEEKIITLSDREAKNAIELLGIEEERLKAIRAIAAIQNLPYEDRVKKEKEVNDEYIKGKQIILDRQNIEFEATRNFTKGWEKALAEYTESSQNSFQTAGKLFGKITGNMEDAIVDFAKTGRFEFKSFMASILEDLLRSQVRNLIASLFGLKSSGGTGSGGLFGGSIIPGFLAKGGSAQAGKPYVVGEKGPELFIPGASGSVVPNNMLGSGGMTNVVYNINAVDTTSFKQLLARDPGFIYAVTEQGRKTVPSTRR